MPVAPEGAEVVTMDAVTIALMVGGLLGALFRAWTTEGQDFTSKTTITDAFLGAIVGILYPMVPLAGTPSGNLAQQGAFMFALTYMGLYSIKDVLNKTPIKVPGFTPKALPILLLPLAVLGCATAPPLLTFDPDKASVAPVLPDRQATPLRAMADALDKLADNPLFNAVNRDANDTLAWVNGPLGPTDPLMKFRASECPTAVILASGDLKAKLAMLRGLILGLDARLASVAGPSSPELLLALTKLRYGSAGQPGSDPKALIATLRHDVAERVTAVVDSCRAVIPIRQMDHALQLAAKAGLLAGTGGAGMAAVGLLP